MTVAELIKYLQTMPEFAEVAILTETGDTLNPTLLEVEHDDFVGNDMVWIKTELR